MVVVPDRDLANEMQVQQAARAQIKDTGAYFKKMRIRLVMWLIALCAEEQIAECRPLSTEEELALRQIVANFTPGEAEKIKKIEAVTNHDVKAVEYFLKEKW